MRYIDCREERDFTAEELTALWNRVAKPFPSSYYVSEKSFITNKNARMWRDYQELIAEEYEAEGGDYSEFSCPLQKWQYLCLQSLIGSPHFN